MERAVFVYTTYPSIVEAEAAGRALVERRLCACVNILPGMVSLYWWQGKIDRGDEVVVQAGDEGIRFLLVSGKPLEEPVAWYGPIVMNTQQQLQEAFQELEKGTFLKRTNGG